MGLYTNFIMCFSTKKQSEVTSSGLTKPIVVSTVKGDEDVQNGVFLDVILVKCVIVLYYSGYPSVFSYFILF